MALIFPLRLPAATMEATRNTYISIDGALYEAVNFMQILELPIDGHIKFNKAFFFQYINKKYNTNRNRKYKDYVYRKMLVQEHLKK